MNNAVIYARFSSHGQNEQTIEGQVRICKEFAEQRGFTVVKTYFDKAKTGTNDNRPDFQRMVKDAAGGAFQNIIVYMFDRFARNRVDSIMYKHQLKEQGVKVISALEPVSDDEGGEFYEMYLEWNAEKYSKRLSKRIRDGICTAIENGTYTGQPLIYGYDLADTGKTGTKGAIKRAVMNEEQAEIVRFVFKEYAIGTSKKEIAVLLNAKGERLNGKPFKARDFDRWLSNDKYTGEFSYGGRVSKNQFPQIIDKTLFSAVQDRLKLNKHFAGSQTAKEPYLLTGKAYCGHCGTPMISDGGTGGNGVQHHYYACKKKKKGLCDKKREVKETIEKVVIERIIQFLQNPKNLNRMADDLVRHYQQRTGDNGLKAVEIKITQAKAKVSEWTVAFVEAKSALLRANIEKQIADYEVLLNDLALQKAKLEIERGAKLTKQDILAFVAEIIKKLPDDKERQQKIVDALLKKVYLYDNRFVCLFGFTDSEIDGVTLYDLTDAIENSDNTLKSVQTLSHLVDH